MHSVANAYPIGKEAHRGVLDGEKVSKFIDEPSRLRVGNPKAPKIVTSFLGHVVMLETVLVVKAVPLLMRYISDLGLILIVIVILIH